MTTVKTLSQLSRTCRTWHDIALPKLYRHLKLVCPRFKYDLSPLENLVISQGKGIKYTTKLEVLPYHSEVAEGSFRRFAGSNHPDDRGSANPAIESATDSFNTLLRLLIRKMDRNQLHYFS